MEFPQLNQLLGMNTWVVYKINVVSDHSCTECIVTLEEM